MAGSVSSSASQITHALSAASCRHSLCDAAQCVKLSTVLDLPTLLCVAAQGRAVQGGRGQATGANKDNNIVACVLTMSGNKSNKQQYFFSALYTILLCA